MVNFFKVLFSILFVAGASHAAEITVKSGEHDDFSRIVVYYAKNAQWSSRLGDEVIEIIGPSSVTGYKVDNVFKFIPRNKILDIYTDPSEANILRIEVPNNYRHKIFQLRGGQLVLDVMESHKDERQLPSFRGWYQIKNSAADKKSNDIASRFFDSAQPAAQAYRENPSFRKSDFENYLYTGLSRASSYGLVSASDRVQINSPSEELEGIKDRNASDDHMLLGSNALTVFDRDLFLLSRRSYDDTAEPSCLYLKEFDFSNYTEMTWHDLHSKNMELRVLDESGKMDADASLDLAKSYLSLNLLNEAQSILSIDPRKDADPYKYMISILSYINSDDFAALANVDSIEAKFEDCPGYQIWKFLQSPQQAQQSLRGIQQVIVSFKNLPPELRNVIALHVLKNFRDIKNDSSISIVANELVQADSTPLGLKLLIDLKYKDGTSNYGYDANNFVVNSRLFKDYLPEIVSTMAISTSRREARNFLTNAEMNYLQNLADQHPDNPSIQRSTLIAGALRGDYLDGLKKFMSKDRIKSDIVFDQISISDFFGILLIEAPDVEFLKSYIYASKNMTGSLISNNIWESMSARASNLGFQIPVSTP